MKMTNKFLALALMAVAMVFTSCSKDDDNDPVVPSQQEIETKIVGKWKYVSRDEKALLTNNKVVITYYGDKTATNSSAVYIDEKHSYVWENKNPKTWSVDGNIVCVKPVTVGFTQFEKIVAIDNNQLMGICLSVIDDGVEHPANLEGVAHKVTADYSQDIIGLWEGVEMTGYETYGDAHHRIEYRADGTYTYYSWDEAAQAWKPLEDVFDEWNVDGDWLATRWQNNGSDVMNYEWWDIDYIKKEGNDIIMKWSALREKEDGERFTTTFTWKKVK